MAFVVFNIFEVKIADIASCIFNGLRRMDIVRFCCLQSLLADCWVNIFLSLGKLISQNFKLFTLKESHVGLDPLDSEELVNIQLVFQNFIHVVTNLTFILVILVRKRDDLVGQGKFRFLSLVFAILPVVWAVELERKKAHLVAQSRKVFRRHYIASWCL